MGRRRASARSATRRFPAASTGRRDAGRWTSRSTARCATRATTRSGTSRPTSRTSSRPRSARAVTAGASCRGTRCTSAPTGSSCTARRRCATGNESCFACHDFGLKFCDTCHTKKPPSHLPADRWKNDPPRRRPRRHPRLLHVPQARLLPPLPPQPRGGLEGEAPDVSSKSEGSDSCLRCHSRSFCSYCHTELRRRARPIRARRRSRPCKLLTEP